MKFSHEGSLKEKVVHGAFWALLEQLGGQIVNFALGIILARILSPNDYGTVALVTVFISVATVLISSGFGQALVQRKEIGDLEFSSVFWMSLVVAGALTGILFFAAPAIASFYGVKSLTCIVRVLSLNLILYAFSSVMNAELYRQMRFDIMFRISLWVAASSAAIGMTLALARYGVWSLVLSSVGSNLVGVAVRFRYVRWRPALDFSLTCLKPLWCFGWRMMIRQLLNSATTNLYGFMTGRFHTRADLAFVNKGRNIPEILAGNIGSAFLESSFPALSRMQDDTARLRGAVRRLLVVSSFIAFPLMAFLAVVSPQLIHFLYGAKWMSCVPYMQLTCAALALFPLNGVCNLAILAKGRSDISLRIDLGQLPLTVLCLVLFLPRSLLLWYSVSTAASLFYVLCFYCRPCCRLLNYSMRTMLRDILPSVLVAGAAGAAAFIAGCILPHGTSASAFFCLIVQTMCEAIALLSVVWLFRPQAACEILLVVRKRLPAKFPLLNRMGSRLSQKLEGLDRRVEHYP